MNIDEIGEELKSLNTIISDIQFNDEYQDLYKRQLYSMLNEAKTVRQEIYDSLTGIDNYSNEIKKILNCIVDMPDIKVSRKKEYRKFLGEIGRGSMQQCRLKEFQIILKISNDFKKDNSLNDLGKNQRFKSADNIDWQKVSKTLKLLYDYLEINNGKQIIRIAQDLSQRSSQLDEKINYMRFQKQLESLGGDWSARKKLVDSLYVGKESRNKVKKSYMANYNISENDFHWNVAFLNGKQYYGKVDLFVGGSPCQSFSLVGKQRGLEDTRGTLFYEYARLVDEIKPKVFIYENVRAVISHDKGNTWKKMQQVFDELGYSVKCDVLNAKNYGIPQNRERLFVVGIRNDLVDNKPVFEFPKPIPLEKK